MLIGGVLPLLRLGSGQTLAYLSRSAGVSPAVAAASCRRSTRKLTSSPRMYTD